MANFNEKINSHEPFFLFDRDSKYFIERVGSMGMFERKIHDDLYFLTNTYRLFIQYKTTHRVKKLAGRCISWDNTDGDHMNDDSRDDCEGFVNPRFYGMESAILITDRHVIMYGDTWIDAAILKKESVICNAYVCGRMVSKFRIQAEVFDRIFGLKENFPMQYAKPVEVETPQSKKIYDAYEISCLMDSNRLCSDLVSSLIRLIGGTNSHYVSKDIYEKSQAARKAVEDLAIELGISICNIENGRQ